tara:strand:+ start:456 stop:1451 length:996 start_codon:yes stop_codon:yes gene_type:complete
MNNIKNFNEKFQYNECVCCTNKERQIISKVGRNFTKLTTVICTGCGLIHSYPIPSKDELHNYYKKDYRVKYKSTLKPNKRHTLRYAKDSLDFIFEVTSYLDYQNYNQRKFLDLGSGSGEISYFAKRIGFDVLGVEPNEGYAQFCIKDLELNIINSTYEEANISEKEYDIINLNQVLEHLPDPLIVLKNLRKFLKDQGMLVLTVPNIQAEIHSPSNRFHYAHVYNYNHLTLKKLFDKSNFTILNPNTISTRIYAKKIEKSDNQINFEFTKNYEEINKILSSNGAYDHFFKATPYKRFLKKVKQYPKEVFMSTLFKDHRSILEYIFNKYKYHD